MALTLAKVKRGQAKQVRGDRAPVIDATWWAKGVDLAPAMVKRCKTKSKIRCTAIAHLRSMPNGEQKGWL